jgi:hypothetical protein
VRTCIVHLICNRLAFLSWKDRKAILPSIKAIYRAQNADMALSGLRSSRPNGASATGVSDPQSEAGHIIIESNVVRFARRQFERRAVASHEFHLRTPPV